MVGKGDTSARVLKDGKPGHVKSLPGKDYESAAKTDKIVGDGYVADPESAFFFENVEPLVAMFE